MALRPIRSPISEPGTPKIQRTSTDPARPPWRWWQRLGWYAGWAVVVGAVFGPLDERGRAGDLVAHIAQHLLLGDVAPLLLAIGVPPRLKAALVTRLAAVDASRRPPVKLLAVALSPAGALVLWALATYAWFLPPLHRAAMPGGVTHVVEHVSFVAFGGLLALAVFDPRPPNAPLAALRHGGLPWWGRHAYSMGSRLFMVPPAIAVAFAGAYAGSGAGNEAASLMIGFEMVLFAFSFVLAFLFLAVSEGARGHR